MGRFIYDTMANSVDIDDRTLAHLRIVVMNKLRRTEAFMFDVEVGDGSGRRSFWMHPSVPIQFHFFGSRQPRINRAWVEDLMQVASGPNGLTITPEPAEESAPAPSDQPAG
ncbi:MAG: ATP-dependent DNA ligase [Microbacterium pygmaeum]